MSAPLERRRRPSGNIPKLNCEPSIFSSTSTGSRNSSASALCPMAYDDGYPCIPPFIGPSASVSSSSYPAPPPSFLIRRDSRWRVVPGMPAPIRPPHLVQVQPLYHLHP